MRTKIALVVALMLVGTGLSACHDHPRNPGEWHHGHHHDHDRDHDG